MYPELRAESLAGLNEIGFEGLALGGLSVGEPLEERTKVLDTTMPLMPKEKARYLMGVGLPTDILDAVRRGVDMFDCVIPTRHARTAICSPRMAPCVSGIRASGTIPSPSSRAVSAIPVSITAARICAI